ncbi:MAG: radical SAM protein [Chloroflexi bacterium]|jgi:7,8-dihydro-6-hydroxymethylpterin dimethyltransferase|nr:radical SAM protein [Chloroflexota bacterium]
MKEILGETKSLCPTCLNVIPATRVTDGSDVFMEKTCPEHGDFSVVIWRGEPSYQGWGRGENAVGAKVRQTESSDGCPHDCGLCGEHRAQTCTVLMEVTGKCNMSCPVCFASSNESEITEPTMAEIGRMLQSIIDAGGPYPLQLSGGEPTLRDDLPEIISMAKEMGFPHIQINTNGIRLAKDKDYLQRLKEARTDLIYLQFDGVSDDVYQKIRGVDLVDLKRRAIENCAEAKIGVQLVPTVIPNVNDHELGMIVQFAKDYIPIVKGIHFQPVSYFGRYPVHPANEDRITTPDVLRALEAQTEGEIQARNFIPRRREDAHCGFSGFFVLGEDGKLVPTTVFKPDSNRGRKPANVSPSEHVRKFIAEKSRYVEAAPEQGNTANKSPWDKFLKRAKTHYLSISGMPFQDAWTVDLERLQGCCIHVVTPQKKLIPFCSYYITNAEGHKLPGK